MRAQDHDRHQQRAERDLHHHAHTHPVSALVIAGVAIKEGRESWRGESCCAADVGLDARLR
jgi:hypothetical protein